MKDDRMFRRITVVLSRPWAIASIGALILLCLSPYFLDAVWGNVPIVFYGRVVDETGKGVPDVEVTMNVIAMKRLSIPVAFAPNQTGWLVKSITDKNGDFVLHGGRGIALNIVSATKAGFADGVYGPGPGHFSYSPNPGVSRFQPNRSRPEILEIRHQHAP